LFDDSIDRAPVIDRRIEAACRDFICEMAEKDRHRRTIDCHERISKTYLESLG